MDLEQILKSLQKGKISVSKAEKLLSLHSIEKIESIAQIDMGRKNRKGIPEVIFADNQLMAHGRLFPLQSAFLQNKNTY